MGGGSSMKKNITELYKQNLEMYHHLENIRSNLWSKDGKSRVSVMVGSGFSLNAEKIESTFSEMALWKDLKEQLLSRLSHRSDLKSKDVLDIAQTFEGEYGRAGLDEILKEAIPDYNYEPGKLHSTFLKLPWADIYTTNYDTLLERAQLDVFERKYQVIYDVNDIPNSVSPRIVKLHGSFPANRPFIFTKNDYEEYPIRFSPFVNMVQQSIMETTFVLIGFSSDDPNFVRWTTWVRKNLGSQMPKVYMIGYKQNERTTYLEEKGITLIDFEEIYEESNDTYKKMFRDLFEFFKFTNREVKNNWPFKPYDTRGLSLSTLKFNRENYPGWVVLPTEIRRKYSKIIYEQGEKILANQDFLENTDQIELINEILWCYEIFLIPLSYESQKKLEDRISRLSLNQYEQNYYPVLKFLLNQSRLDFDEHKFTKFLSFLSSINLDENQKNELVYEEILFNLSFNNIEITEKMLNSWELGNKDIEWKIKKARLYITLLKKEDAKEILENSLRTIRRLLSIDNDSYKLMSLESVCLNLLRYTSRVPNYDLDRKEELSLKKCNTTLEYHNLIVSIKTNEKAFAITKKRGFDPGKKKVSHKFGNTDMQPLLDSYALLNLIDFYSFSSNEKSQYKIAIENVQTLFPFYSLTHLLFNLDSKSIEESYSREYVYNLDEARVTVLSKILSSSLKLDKSYMLQKENAIELLSRIYFRLNKENKEAIDNKIFELIKSNDNLSYGIKTSLNGFFERAFFDKTKVEKTQFINKLMEYNLKSQSGYNDSRRIEDYFDPISILLSKTNEVSIINVPRTLIDELISTLEATNDLSLYETALIRLIFLKDSNSLDFNYEEKLKEILVHRRKEMISEIIFPTYLQKIIQGNGPISDEDFYEWIYERIPVISETDKNGVVINLSTDRNLENYFKKMAIFFPHSLNLIRNQSIRPHEKYYRIWLDEFYTWWESQKKYVLHNPNELDYDIFSSNYLLRLLAFLKDNILAVINKEMISEIDKELMLSLYKEIKQTECTDYLLLIPYFERLDINIDDSYQSVLKKMRSHDDQAVISATTCIFDYLILVKNQELKLEAQPFVQEILTLVEYSSGEIFNRGVKILSLLLEQDFDCFITTDYERLIEFITDYYFSLNKGKILIDNQERFEEISNLSELVYVLYEKIGDHERFKHMHVWEDWKKYILNHRLPEVRKYQM